MMTANFPFDGGFEEADCGEVESVDELMGGTGRE